MITPIVRLDAPSRVTGALYPAKAVYASLESLNTAPCYVYPTRPAMPESMKLGDAIGQVVKWSVYGRWLCANVKAEQRLLRMLSAGSHVLRPLFFLIPEDRPAGEPHVVKSLVRCDALWPVPAEDMGWRL